LVLICTCFEKSYCTYVKDVEVLGRHVVRVFRSNLLGLLEVIAGNGDVGVAELAKVVDERRRHQPRSDQEHSMLRLYHLVTSFCGRD